MALSWCFIVVVMALLKGATAAETYVVGDSLGWEVPPNSSYYSKWASNKTFYVGDKLVMALLKGATAAQTYLVGGSFGWKVPPNSSYYTIWASKRTFYVGDKLAFNWTGSHTVGISHIQAEHDNCTRDPGQVLNSSGPGVIVPLPTSGSFYFYCTVDDRCGSGQKFAMINALTNGSEPPSPSSASSFTISAFVAAVVSTIVITVLIYD